MMSRIFIIDNRFLVQFIEPYCIIFRRDYVGKEN